MHTSSISRNLSADAGNYTQKHYLPQKAKAQPAYLSAPFFELMATERGTINEKISLAYFYTQSC